MGAVAQPIVVMPKWLGKCFCMVAILGVLDGHLMLAQTWAWMTMLQDRAPELGVGEAIGSTFSGDAPCPMCCSIKEKRQEKERDAPVPESQPTMKFPWVGRVVMMVTAPVGKYIPRSAEVSAMVVSRLDAPPSPPPRVVV
ncbi:MAG: hypothetical protein KJO21_02270 [Verrucomicrobiae bacterium]|nr:hypothetical protein [Verrucomicrobiae bacterium]NNJ44125.1 hypothetical protein [Akkermansiaceae bacterium]